MVHFGDAVVVAVVVFVVVSAEGVALVVVFWLINFIPAFRIHACHTGDFITLDVAANTFLLPLATCTDDFRPIVVDVGMSMGFFLPLLLLLL